MTAMVQCITLYWVLLLLCDYVLKFDWYCQLSGSGSNSLNSRKLPGRFSYGLGTRLVLSLLKLQVEKRLNFVLFHLLTVGRWSCSCLGVDWIGEPCMCAWGRHTCGVQHPWTANLHPHHSKGKRADQYWVMYIQLITLVVGEKIYHINK